MQVLDFDEALGKVSQSKKHLLMGNGFSQALRPDIFNYGALFDMANFEGLPSRIRDAFEVLDTRDFEYVMKALSDSSLVSQVYLEGDSAVPDKMREDYGSLKEVLVNAIAHSHPDRPHEIGASPYAFCKRFLSNFEKKYTLNYDLLLYWALMQNEVEPRIDFDDGFRKPYSGDEEYVSWEIEHTNTQTVHYLHGAMHLYDAGNELQKYTWVNTGVPLIEQIRSALSADKFPLFVSEGESHKKIQKINHSNYLSRSLRSFSNIQGSLFVYGHSLADNDWHILRLIEVNRIRQLFVSIFGDPDNDENKRVMERAVNIKEQRPSWKPLEVLFYDAQSAKVWG